MFISVFVSQPPPNVRPLVAGGADHRIHPQYFHFCERVQPRVHEQRHPPFPSRERSCTDCTRALRFWCRAGGNPWGGLVDVDGGARTSPQDCVVNGNMHGNNTSWLECFPPRTLVSSGTHMDFCNAGFRPSTSIAGCLSATFSTLCVRLQARTVSQQGIFAQVGGAATETICRGNNFGS